MNDYFFFVADFLKGKPIYPTLRRVMNSLFSVSLVSFLFERFYFHYHWLDLSDYKGALDFVVRGVFFIPLCLFLLVYFVFDFCVGALFFVSATKRSSRLTAEFYEWEFKKEEYREMVTNLNDNPLVTLPFPVDQKVIKTLFLEIRAKLPLKELQELEALLQEQRNALVANFQLCFKGIFCITVYFMLQPYFGWLLFVLTLLVLLIILRLFYFAYILLDVVPAAVRRFYHLLEERFTERP